MGAMSASLKLDTGKTNIVHNNRTMSDKEKELNPHIDESRSSENKYLVEKDIKEVYKEEFGEALEKYNAKQKRNDRKIKDYYKHICASKKTKPQQEMIIQVGNKDDFSSREDYEKANQILEEWFNGFAERNPNLKVYNAVIHNDEATPHLHLNFVPVAEDYKRGLEKQVSFNKAIASQDENFNQERPFENWREKEMAVLENLMKERGIERKLVGTNDYKDVNDYKEKKQLESEIQELEAEKETVLSDLRAFKKPKEIVERIEQSAKSAIFTDKVTLPSSEYKKLIDVAKSSVKIKYHSEKKMSAASEEIQNLKASVQRADQRADKFENRANELEKQLEGTKGKLIEVTKNEVIFKSKLQDTNQDLNISELEKKGRLIMFNLENGHNPRNAQEGEEWLSVLQENKKAKTIPENRLEGFLGLLKAFLDRLLEKSQQFSMDGLKRQQERINNQNSTKKKNKSKSYDMEL